MKYAWIFESLGASTSEFAKTFGYQVTGPFSERHGSWELTLHRRSGDLDRFVSLALVATRSGGHLGRYDVELWGGAEDGTRFTRRLVSKLRARQEDLDQSDFRAALRDSLE